MVSLQRYLDEDGPEIAEVASSRTPAGVTDSSHTSVNRSYATTTTNPYVYKDINEVYGSIKSLTGTSTHHHIKGGDESFNREHLFSEAEG